MKGHGFEIKERERAMNGMLARTFTEASLWRGRLTVRELTTGRMVICMRENGLMECGMDMESGPALMGTSILVNGSIQKLKAMAFTLPQMETSMRENGKKGLSMEAEQSTLQMETFISANTAKDAHMGLANTSGSASQCMSASSTKVLSRGKENGRKTFIM